MNLEVGKLTVDRFESLLEAYGGDLARWPAQHGSAAQALLRGSAAARRRLAEAQALDRLLDKASEPDPQRLSRLADRIVAVAAAEPVRRQGAAAPAAVPPVGTGEGARIIRLPVPRKGSTSQPSDLPHAAVASVAAPPRRQWRAAAALAASLLIGVVIGLTDIGETTTLGVASFGSTAFDTETLLSALQIDEDQI